MDFAAGCCGGVEFKMTRVSHIFYEESRLHAPRLCSRLPPLLRYYCVKTKAPARRLKCPVKEDETFAPSSACVMPRLRSSLNPHMLLVAGDAE